MRINTGNAYQFSLVMRQLSVLLVSFLLVRVGWNQQLIGSYETLLLFGTTVTSFWVQGYSQTLFTVFPSMTPADQQKTSFAVVIIGKAMVLILAALGIGGLFISGEGNTRLLAIYSLYLLFNVPYLYYPVFLFLGKKEGRLTVYTIIWFVLQTAAVIGPAYCGFGIEYSLWALVVFGFMNSVLFVAEYANTNPFTGFAATVRSVTRKAWPLILVAFIGGFRAWFDGWLVNFYIADLALFAIFRYGSKEVPFLSILPAGLSNTSVAAISGNKGEGLDWLKRKTSAQYNLMFPGIIVLLLISPFVFRNFLGEEYLRSAHIFNILSLTYIARLLFPQAVVLGLGGQKTILRVSVWENIVNVGLSVALIIPFGIEGVAWATVIAFLFEKVCYIIYIHKRHDISFSQYTPVAKYLIGTVAVMATFIAVGYFF